jgi:uncharacterized protein with gpF-like domain
MDELNSLVKEIQLKDIDIEQYFNEMDLSEKEKKRRIELAYSLKNALAFLFYLILTYEEYEGMNAYNYELYIEVIILNFKNQYREALLQNTELSEELDSYIDYFSTLVVTKTLEHMDETYYLSDVRTSYIAVNEANVVGDMAMFEQAKADGKTLKQWVDMKDNRERKSHLAVGGTILPIDEYFTVGKSKMLYPHDRLHCDDESELSNCRCTIKYF